MWILKEVKNNKFRYFVAPYNILLKYIKENYKNINKIDDYNFICCDENQENNIKIEIHLGEKVHVQQENNTLFNRKHR